MKTPVLLLIVAALILAIICTITPNTEVTLNHDGTDVIGFDAFGLSSPPQAPATEHAAIK